MVLFASCNNKTDINKEVKSVNTNHSTKLKALIIDGENNHGLWPKTTMMLKAFLEDSELFSVDIERTKYLWQGPHHGPVDGLKDVKDLLVNYPLNDGKEHESVEEPKPDESYSPDFSQYDVVISNMGWKASTWNVDTKASFEQYMKDGGGLVVIHAANNSWGDWDEYNKMIGVGGWGGRDVKSGPYVYYDKEEKLVKDPVDGMCGSHGPEYEWIVTTRAADHPIMKGLPSEWLHAKDELYDRMRGPAENMTVLATAFSDIEKNAPPWDKKTSGSDRHEPILSTINYHNGRTFHTTMGHMDYSIECVGFITTFLRGSEWAATGEVTQPIPLDFPSADAVSSRKWR